MGFRKKNKKNKIIIFNKQEAIMKNYSFFS